MVPLCLVLGCASLVWGQAENDSASKKTVSSQEQPNSGTTEEDWSLHFQNTVIYQARGSMASPYAGPNSFSADPENATSLTSTIFLGRRLWPNAALYFDPEVAGGMGLSGVFGIAGAPNGETTRVATSAPKAFIARLYLEQSIDLGSDYEPVPPNPNQLAGRRCTKRLVFMAGKLSATDIFDGNAYSHDPRTQFMNWSLMYNGAWDYPADVRGYTYGSVVQLIEKTWAIRYGLFAMPDEANGPTLDHNVDRAHGQALEFEYDYAVGDRPGKVRLMGYRNSAHMGNYRETIHDPAFGLDITLSRAYSVKYGVTLNAEQRITDDMGMFFRAGWDDGRTETFAFTEIDRTLQAGLSCQGSLWNRPEDTAGIAIAVNGLSNDHRDYLATGGLGFMLGDGQLAYGPEKIFEAYYSARLAKVLFFGFDVQFVDDPGFNRDRGPVSIFGIRIHIEF